MGNNLSADGASEVYAHPQDPERVYVGAASWSNGLREDDTASRLMKSTDGGGSWQEITPPGVPLLVGRPALAVVWSATSSEGVLYAAFHGDTIYKSTDGGSTWSEISTGLPVNAGAVIFSLVVDPDDPNQVYAGLFPDMDGAFGDPFAPSGGLYHTTNGGASWPRVMGYPHDDIVAVRFAGNPKRLFVGGWTIAGDGFADGALMVSDDGSTFTEVLAQPFVQDVIDAPGAPGTLYAAASSTYTPGRNQNAGLYRSTDNGNTWMRLEGNLPHTYVWSLAIFPDEPDHILMGTDGDGVIAANLTASSPSSAIFRVDNQGNVYSDRAYYCDLASGCFNTGGADIAEYVNISEPVEPGDVVELDPDHPGYYRKSSSPYSTLASGVISSTPGITIGSQPESRPAPSANLNLTISGLGLDKPINDTGLTIGNLSLTLSALDLSISRLLGLLDQGLPQQPANNQPLLALMGMVPAKATTENGPIQPGDLLTASSTPGYAMRCGDPKECEGAIIGKAMEPLQEGTGIIKMLVMR